MSEPDTQEVPLRLPDQIEVRVPHPEEIPGIGPSLVFRLLRQGEPCHREIFGVSAALARMFANALLREADRAEATWTTSRPQGSA